MSELFHLELELYCLSFKDERAIQGQLPKVLLPMIGIPDGWMGGRNSYSTSPMSSAHSRDRHLAGSFRRSAAILLIHHKEQGTYIMEQYLYIYTICWRIYCTVFNSINLFYNTLLHDL